MKVLIIEDEQDLLNLILRYLKREGYLCEYACNLKEGFKKINNYDYDCVIVDLNLPEGDGLKLVSLLRKDNTDTGIVIVSARDTVEDRIKGLELGADDYLTKPFNLSELNARIKAVMRRKTGHFSNELKFDGLVINLDEHTVNAGGAELNPTKKEYHILH